jgi:hypothetical protein
MPVWRAGPSLENEFDYAALDGSKTGSFAALPVPVRDFKANANKATSVIKFTATSVNYALAPIERMSNQIILFRAIKN